jgi:hypothetical protein
MISSSWCSPENSNVFPNLKSPRLGTKPQSNWEYRKQLQKNTIPIMNYNNLNAQVGTNIPSCTSSPPPDNVIGDLTQQYYKNFDLNKRMISPSVILH